MEQLRKEWPTLTDNQRVNRLIEGAQGFDSKLFKNAPNSDYKMGSEPKIENGHWYRKVNFTGSENYKIFFHSQRDNILPSGPDIKAVKSGTKYFILYNPLIGTPSVVQFGVEGFWFWKTAWVQPIIKVEF